MAVWKGITMAHFRNVIYPDFASAKKAAGEFMSEFPMDLYDSSFAITPRFEDSPDGEQVLTARHYGQSPI
jgi:hypothetical protein